MSPCFTVIRKPSGDHQDTSMSGSLANNKCLNSLNDCFLCYEQRAAVDGLWANINCVIIGGEYWQIGPVSPWSLSSSSTTSAPSSSTSHAGQIQISILRLHLKKTILIRYRQPKYQLSLSIKEGAGSSVIPLHFLKVLIVINNCFLKQMKQI